VPNEFGKCKVRVEIRDDSLTFYHNGDPFRVSDLESLVAQYSSKSEENNVNTETTGKYGTGFITTYILSRKVRIKGLLGITIKGKEAHPENDPVNPSEQPIFQASEEEIHNKSSFRSKSKKDQYTHYQRFETVLDREYKDRDK
jgi:hypothetical protein